MPTVGSITKTVRINPTDLVIIEGLMKDGTSWSGAIHKLCENYSGVPSVPAENPDKTTGTPSKSEYDLPGEAMKDIEGMANFCGMSLYDAMLEVDRMLNDGTLMIGDEIKVVMPSWVTKIEEVCHDRCVSVDAFGKKVLDMIERGQI